MSTIRQIPQSAIERYPTVSQFVGVSRDKIVTYPNGRKLRFLLYAAYNAMGLIGPEYNGIAILDEDQRRVLVDNIAKEMTGYFGPSDRQLDEFDRIVELPLFQVRELVHASDRYRGGM